MDHKALLASLSPQQRQQLTRRSNSKAVVPLLVHFGLIGVGLFLILTEVTMWQLLIPPMGILLVFLFTLLHETSHRTPFRSRSFNIAVAWVCGLVVLVPPRWFRYFHIEHHRYTQDPDRDPELLGKKPETLLEYGWHITGLPVWYSQLKTLLVNASGQCTDSFVPAAVMTKVRNESLLFLLIYFFAAAGLIFTGYGEVVFKWIVCLLVGQPFLRLYLLAEHGRCPFVDNMFENTRTTVTNRIVRALAWNMPFHAEHHAYPNVPFYKLPEFHDLIKSQLKVTSNGYVGFHRSMLRDL